MLSAHRQTVATKLILPLVCLGLWLFGSGARAAADPFGQPLPVVGATPGPGPGHRSPWKPLTHQPPFRAAREFGPGSMFLMSDGSVLLHQDDTRDWMRLVPDHHGSYLHGRWQHVPPLPAGYAPLYFTSAVLPDGRLVLMGGEYDGGDKQVETNLGAIFDPQTNRWRTLAPPPGWASVGDAQSTVLTDGQLMVGQPESDADAVLSERTLTWSLTGAGKQDPNAEEGFSLLPDGRVLTVDSFNQASELFDPVTGTWSSGGRIPVRLVGAGDEQGPLVSGPDGNVLAVGATSHTAIYHPVAGGPGTWSAGPSLPRIAGEQMVASDAAGARLPNGYALLDVDPAGQVAPVHFLMFDGRHLKPVPDNPDADTEASYNTRMLVLPTGQILYDDTQSVYIFRTTGGPQAAWRPSVTSHPSRMGRGRAYTISGTQLAGRDQGAAYGDDFQDSTNYPLVRIVNSRSGVVTYARTRDWSSVSTAPGAPSSTTLTLPGTTPLGPSMLVAVANGIASRPVAVTVTR
jgi:hypothetical protein